MKRCSVKSLGLSAAAALALLVAGCGEIVNMSRTKSNPRRVYVNDAAANDSLAVGVRRDGLLVQMQPGESYRLRMKDAGATDSLHFYVRSTGGTYTRTQILGSTALANGYRVFTLQTPADKIVADYYLVFLNGTNGSPAAAPDSVRLAPTDTTVSSTVAVRLLLVRGLHVDGAASLATLEEKAVYARAFQAKLKSVYAAQGITVDTSTVIVDPDGAPLTVSFAGGSPQIPGTRVTGGVNVYVVDNINAGGVTENTVLGFSPREAPDMSTNLESRVVLNVRGGTAAELAVTAAHEIGHFFGLRHTTATAVDREFDGDASNRDDGFASTPYCALLVKRAASEDASAREIVRNAPDGRPYCLRVAAPAADCYTCPDDDNLMFPYSCPGVTQETLGGDQRFLLRNNLKTYQ